MVIVLADKGWGEYTTLLIAAWKLRRMPRWVAEWVMFVHILLEKKAYVISYHLFLGKLSLGCMKIWFGRDCRFDNHLDV